MNKLLKKVCSAVLVCAFCLSTAASAFALDNGTYTMNTETHYLNPDTGKTDDGGTGNAELGEGMCRSAVYEKALVEQSGEGTTITMRMLLYSNLTNIRIATQDAPKGKYTQVKYSVIKESSSNDSADIKFSAPSAGGLVQVKMYVAPMGRDVCFYWNCNTSTAVSGSDGFAQSEKSTTAKTAGDKLTDINNHWAESAIKEAVNKGLFSGTTEITFSPDKEMTRGMFVTVLGRMSGEKISGKSTFKDVDNSQYYAPYVAWANKNGIVSGTSSTTFSPNSPVTCEQAAAILVKYAKYKGVALGTKSISPSTTGVSSWAKDSVVAAGKGGIITKQNTNGYYYTSSATRADVASMMVNYSNFYAK